MRSFTLIELLVVVAIIGILASLILSAVSAAKQKAKRVRAKNEVDQLYQAWTSYYQDYKTPVNLAVAGSGKFKMDTTAMLILGGSTTNGQNYNAIRYMEFSSNTKYFCDPWGVKNTTTGAYWILMDFNNENKITYDGPSGSTDIFVSVGVYSAGPDGALGTIDDITSWKR